MTRCFFCRREGFKGLDGASLHLWGLKSDGTPSCPGMDIGFLAKVDRDDKWFG